MFLIWLFNKLLKDLSLRRISSALVEIAIHIIFSLQELELIAEGLNQLKLFLILLF